MSAAAGQDSAAREAVGERIAQILAQPEFRGLRPRARPFWEQWAADAARWLAELLGIGVEAAGQLLASGVWVLLGLLALVGLWLVVRLLRARRGGSHPGVGAAPDTRARRAAGLTARARAAAECGELLLALRLYFTALAVGLGERGDLDYRDAWTNRELLARAGAQGRARELLAGLVPSLDRQSFGGERVERADVERLEQLCRRELGA